MDTHTHIYIESTVQNNPTADRNNTKITLTSISYNQCFAKKNPLITETFLRKVYALTTSNTLLFSINLLMRYYPVV